MLIFWCVPTLFHGARRGGDYLSFLTTWYRLHRERTEPCWNDFFSPSFQTSVGSAYEWHGWIIGALPLTVVDIGRGRRLDDQWHVEVWLSEGVATVGRVALEAEVCLGWSLAVIRPRSVPGERGQPSSSQESAGSVGKKFNAKNILTPSEQWNRSSKALERNSAEYCSRVATFNKAVR